MAINLHKLPEPLPPVKKLNIKLWLIGAVIFVVLGGIVTLGISFSYQITSLQFWFGAVIFPLLVWLICFLVATFLMGYREYYVSYFNQYRQQRYQTLVNFAQRPLFIVFSQLVTKDSNLAESISQHKLTLQSIPPRSGGVAFPHTALAVPVGVSESDLHQRIKIILSDFTRSLPPDIKSLNQQAPLHVRLFLDMSLERDSIIQSCSSLLANKLKITSIESVAVEESVTFLDHWLDQPSHDNDMLLIISANLTSSLKSGMAESASIMLLLGQQLIKDYCGDETNITAVYRPETGPELPRLINNALLWSEQNKQPLNAMWRTDTTIEMNTNVLQFLKDQDINIQASFDIDSAIGSAGNNAFWLALGIAAESLQQKPGKQFILTGKELITVCMVARYK